MPNFLILGFWGWDFVTSFSNGVIKQTDKAVDCKATSSWSPKLLHIFFFFAFSFYPYASHFCRHTVLPCVEISISQGKKYWDLNQSGFLLSLRARKP